MVGENGAAERGGVEETDGTEVWIVYGCSAGDTQIDKFTLGVFSSLAKAEAFIRSRTLTAYHFDFVETDGDCSEHVDEWSTDEDCFEVEPTESVDIVPQHVTRPTPGGSARTYLYTYTLPNGGRLDEWDDMWYEVTPHRIDQRLGGGE